MALPHGAVVCLQYDCGISWSYFFYTQSLFVLAKDLKNLTDLWSFNCKLLHKVSAACF